MKNKIGVAASIYDRFGIEKAFSSISKIGFKNIELVYAEGFVEKLIKKPEEMNNDDINEIIGLSKNYKTGILALSVYSYFMKENAVYRFKKVIDVAKTIGADFIVTDTGEIGMEDVDSKKTFYNEVKEAADYARSNDITICLEIHGGWYSNGRQGSEIIKTINHPNLRINYDTGNVIYFGGIKPENDIEYALPFMAFMHLKDKSGEQKEWNFPAIGEGDINFKKIFKSIKDYNGPISLEVELTQDEHTLEEVNTALKKSYDFLKSFGYL